MACPWLPYGMLSLEHIQALMAGEGFSDAELDELRKLLWLLAQVTVDHRQRSQARNSGGGVEPTSNSPPSL